MAQALTAAQRVIALNDASPPGRVVLGYVYLWQKQYEPAIAEMERATALDPNNADVYALLAEALQQRQGLSGCVLHGVSLRRGGGPGEIQPFVSTLRGGRHGKR